VTSEEATAPSSPARSALGRVLRVIAWLVPLGVLAQAVLAGQSTFAGAGLIGLHGGLGHGVLLLSIITAGLAWVTRVRMTVAVLASLAVVALIGQTGLGYAGSRTGLVAASALHIPLGVLIVGLTTVVATWLSVGRR
jgi:hypothetical protein